MYDKKVDSFLNLYTEESVVPGTVDKIFNTKLSDLTKGMIDIPKEYDMSWNDLSNFDGWLDIPAWIYNVAAVFEPTGILSWPAFVEAIQEFEKEQSPWNSIFLILATLSIIPVGGKPMKVVWAFFKFIKWFAVKILKFLPGARLAERMLGGISSWCRGNSDAIDNISKSAIPKLNKIYTASGRKSSQVYINFLRTNKLIPEDKIRNLEKLIKQTNTAVETAAKSADDAAAAKTSKEMSKTEKAAKASQAADDAAKAKAAENALKTSKEVKAAEKAIKNIDDAKKLKAAKGVLSANKAAKAAGIIPATVGLSRTGNAIKDPLGREIDYHKEKGEEFLNKLKQLAADSKKKPTLMRRAGFPSGKIGDIRSGGSF